MANVKVCSKCGVVTNADFAFCDKCGGSLVDTGYTVSQWNSLSNDGRVTTVNNILGKSSSRLRMSINNDSVNKGLDEASKFIKSGISSINSFATNPGGSGLYKNVGDKLCKLASFFAIVGIVISCLTGISFIATAMNFGRDAAFPEFLVGLAIAGLGSFLSWFASLTMYGFGELINRTNEIAESLRK